MTKIRKIGNSLGVILPANVLESEGLEVGTEVTIEYQKQNGGIEIRKKNLSCADLCSGWSDNSDPSDPIDWGSPVGEENVLW